MGRPLVAVSVGFHDFGDYLGVGYQRPLARAGATPVILSRVPDVLDDVLDRCGGLMLAAGHDIDPRYYGATPSDQLSRTDPARDTFEIDLVRRAMNRRMPIIGSCRGMQMLNVALGGTLVQDLGDVPAWADHPSDPGWRSGSGSRRPRCATSRCRRIRATRSRSSRAAG